MKAGFYRQWLVTMVIVAAMAAILKFMVIPWFMPETAECTILRTHTVQQDEILSEVALREIKAQKANWPQSISFNLLIQNTVATIQVASGLNSPTPSAGTVLQIPNLNDPDC
jgi:hypothetical protein